MKLLALAVVVILASGVIARRRVLSNNPITVSRGKSVFFDPTTDFQVEVEQGDRCEIRILGSPLEQNIGFVTKDRFPCDYAANTIQYIHLGSLTRRSDKISAQAIIDGASETIAIPFTIAINVAFVQLEIVTDIRPLDVPAPGGDSDPIDERKLTFVYDDTESECLVTLLHRPNGLPFYGELINAEGKGIQQNCTEFLASGIRYRHTKPPSPNRDYIPVVVELRDKSTGEVTNKEFFQILVRIRNAEPNVAPRRTFDAIYLLEVHQYISTAITREVLGAEDDETPAGQLIFNITKDFAEGEGYLFSTDDRYQPLDSFKQQDIFDLKIGYAPPKEDSDERRVIEIGLQVVDSEGATSDEIQFLIIVNPKNTMAPLPTRNRGFTLYEGQKRAFTRKVLVISDEDNLADVTLTFLRGPFHGRVYRQLLGGATAPVSTFSMKDLKDGVIWYEHDGSEMFSDNIIFRASDGINNVDFLFPVIVISVDDKYPVLIANTALFIQEGDLVPITEFVLSASDVDSDDSSIRYVLETTGGPRNGQLLYRTRDVPSDLTGFRRVGEYYEKVITSFTQADVLNGFIFYRHSGSETVRDSFSFKLQDSLGNTSPVLIFLIKGEGVDDETPSAVIGKPFALTVSEKKLTAITGDHVLFTDIDSDDDDLVYTITSGPRWVSSSDTGSPGKLVECENASKEVTSFVQKKVRYLKICFLPPAEVGSDSKQVEFTFSVADAAGNILTGLNFTITVMPVDDQASEVDLATVIPIAEGKQVTITRTFLYASDADTTADKLTFTIVSIPENGFVSRAGVPLKVGDMFTLADIDGGLVVYRHSGSETNIDQFQFIQSDGTNEKTITAKIAVSAQDDTKPQLVHANPIAVEENGIAVITPEIITATDVDSNDFRLRFVVVRPPTKGEIQVSGIPADSFTQEDLINGLVTYVHTAGEIGINEDTDNFTLDINDTSTDVPGGNVLRSVDMTVTILPVDDQPPVVRVTPGFEVIEGGRSRITFTNLTISDVDTDVSTIICRVTVTPDEGFVENIAPVAGGEKSRANKPITFFRIKDVMDGNINYVQDRKMGESDEATADRFALVCGDDAGNEATQVNFDVTVVAMNDEKPRLFIREFVLDEGGDLVIDRAILNAEDDDVPVQTLTFIITKQPVNGRILRQTLNGTEERVNKFDLSEITDASVILYNHDDSETTSDSFNIILTDGKHEVPGVVQITINPVDDESPRLKINRGLYVTVLGGSAFIEKRLLTATDIDSVDSTLTYVLRQLPRIGYLQVFANGVWRNTTLNQNFTQKQIHAKHVRFLSNGKEGGRDKIRFDLTDGINSHFDLEFIIDVRRIDSTPVIVRTKMLIVDENGFAIITTDYLSATDDNTDDKDLKFMILTPPQFGHLENTDNPGAPISMFTQIQLAGNKIIYRHTDSGEDGTDTFEVRVTDGTNDVVRSFMVGITGGDDELPVLENRGLTLAEGETKVITPYELNVEDADVGTDKKKLVYVVKQSPRHGRILRKGRVVSRFNQHDIENNYISYEHDGSDTISDEFLFTVSDSVHNQFIALPNQAPTRRAQKFQVTIQPVEDVKPVLKVMNPTNELHIGGTPGHMFPKNMVGTCFTSGNLRATDPDSDDDMLEYWPTTPDHGYFINIDNASQKLDHFTQREINQQKICYILKDVNVTNGDSFTFKIMDAGQNALVNQRITLSWAFISMAQTQYTVNENAGSLTVKVIRRGDLTQPAFVKIAVKSGKATKGLDFKGSMSGQLHFGRGVSESTYKITIVNDALYEKSEDFTVELSEPVKAVLSAPSTSVVTILDPEDEPTLSLGEVTYKIQEDIGEIRIPVTRTGDLTKETTVMCITMPDTATGTVPSTVLSFSDYITRPEDQKSIIEFYEGEKTKDCVITVVEDTQNEPDETFTVKLVSVLGSKVGSVSESKVTILRDESDVPVFQLEFEEYKVNEDDGEVAIKILRYGTDLSQTAMVQFGTARSKPKSAQSGVDYLPKSEMISFAPGVSSKIVKVVILDDAGRPQLEGPETFEVMLRMPANANLGSVSRATVTIDDSASDIPGMQFKERTVTVNEEDGTISVTIVRTGDLSKTATVRCFTRQSSAQVMMDYAERPNSDSSIVTFKPGEREQKCTVELMDDDIAEDEEMFELVLYQPASPEAGGAKLNEPAVVRILVKDSDKSSVGFETTRYRVQEPAQGNMSYVNVAIVRTGDRSKTSSFVVYTQDVSAISNIDYEPFSRNVLFGFNVSRVLLPIGILGDAVRETSKTFKIVIEADANGIAELGNSRATIFIMDYGTRKPGTPGTGGSQTGIGAIPVFPASPEVVSLKDYDQSSSAEEQPPAGYPVVCVTSCNPKYSDYAKTSPHCIGVNDSLTYYFWEVATSGASDFQRVTLATFMTSVNSIVLDSIYFRAGSRVRCTAAPRDGATEGPSRESEMVTIGPGDEFCPRFDDTEVGAEPYSTTIKYLGPDDPNNPNMVEVTVRIQHSNGLIPVISTRPLTSSNQLLTQSSLRTATHSCSNLLQPQEVATRAGFSSMKTGNDMARGDVTPYQYNSLMRTDPTLRFYRNLNLQTCTWTFVGYYSMDELVTSCGGTVDREPTVRDNTKSHLTVRIPLHVGFYYLGRGQANQVISLISPETKLRMSFVYDTQVLWENGLSSSSEQEVQGTMYPQRIYISETGQLVVEFQTVAGFRGQFIADGSVVTSTSYPNRQFILQLISSDPTVESAKQQWRFTSTLSHSDYSDNYEVNLVPCTVAVDVGYSNPLQCDPKDKITLSIPLRFQQTTAPVKAEYTLSTQFFIMGKRSAWLMPATADFGEQMDQTFADGTTVFGRVQIDPAQRVGDAYNLKVEQVYVCAGKNGYSASYDPAKSNFGCLGNPGSLLFSHKIIDRQEPGTAVLSMGSLPFNAKLAAEDGNAGALVSDSNADGFSFSAAPLYTTGANTNVYVHALFSVGRSGRRRREILHAVSRHRRADEAFQLKEDEGTGMQILRLKAKNKGEQVPAVVAPRDSLNEVPTAFTTDDRQINDEVVNPGDGSSLVPIIAGAVGGLVVIAVIIAVAVVVSRRKRNAGDAAQAKEAPAKEDCDNDNTEV
eukprot:m.18164 g.18164  ORF g.18164 m.18164 type:complete len:3072 (+) comp27610_c0_seq1:382-9597(+)